MAKEKVNWQQLKQEYATRPATTYKSLAREYGVSARTIAYHGTREGWSEERERYCAEVDSLLVWNCARSATVTIQEINAEYLRRCDELQALLEFRLWESREDGSLVPRPNVTISDISRAIVAFGQLYDTTRLALGADNGVPPSPQDRFSEMSEDELLEELRRLRKRDLIH